MAFADDFALLLAYLKAVLSGQLTFTTADLVAAGSPAFWDAVSAVAALLALYLVFWQLVPAVKRLLFSRRYGVPISRAFRVRHHAPVQRATFALAYPRWEFAKRDGTRDMRRSSNKFMYGTCELLIDDYGVTCHKPVNMVLLVNNLRDAGHEVDPCAEECQKQQVAYENARRRYGLAVSSQVYQAFSDCPTDFEEYCAQLYRSFGYAAETTQRTNDGGYDLVMTDPEGRSCIAECKNYEPGNIVGRPLIQKLVGANSVVGASRLIFLTTSSFSSEAFQYAQSAGVELVDGEALTRMLDRRRAAESLSGAAGVSISRADWELTTEDVYSHYPADAVDR